VSESGKESGEESEMKSRTIKIVQCNRELRVCEGRLREW